MEFIEKIKPIAIKLGRKYNILPSLIMAQTCLESGFGRKAPGNNYFGVKWSKGYDFIEFMTSEFEGGKWIRKPLRFRKYSSMEESIEDYCKLLQKPRYKRVIESTTYKQACENVKACGYATDPLYTNKLIRIIEKYNLNECDGIMPELSIGSKGEAVVFLQSELSKRGYKLKPDGNFGKLTLEAVKKFQSKSNLPDTGIVRKSTWDKLV